MQKFIFILSLLFAGSQGFAQNGFHTVAAAGGFSSSNSKIISLTYETSKNSYKQWGIIIDGIFHSTEKKQLDFQRNKTYLAAGLYFKKQLAATRNFRNCAYIGAAAGSNNSDFIYYPFGGLEQSFYLSAVTQFFINERVIYLFKIDANNWQPSLNIGFKFNL